MTTFRIFCSWVLRLIVFAFSDNLSAENSKLSAEFVLQLLQLSECMRDIHDFNLTINRALSQYWGLLGLQSVDPNAREARIRSHSTTPVIKGDPCTLDIKYMVGK